VCGLLVFSVCLKVTEIGVFLSPARVWTFFVYFSDFGVALSQVARALKAAKFH